MKFGRAICIFFSYENLICRSTDISKCFRGSLQLRDNESRLYLKQTGESKTETVDVPNASITVV